MWQSYNNTITNNTANLNNGTGISLDNSSNNNITDNTANLNNGNGINLGSSSDNTLTNNTANNNTNAAITLGSSSNHNTLINNDMSDNDEGLRLESSTNNTFTDNNVINNTGAGIYIDSSSNNTFMDNNISSNSGDGIYLDSSSSNNFTGNSLNLNSGNGIRFDSSNDNTLTSNIVSNTLGACGNGIYIYYSDDNTLVNNTVSANGGFCGDGIRLESSSNNNLTGNTVESSMDYGIYLESSSNYNTLTNNTAWNNSYGILLSFSSNYNTVTANNVSNNSYSGISVDSNSNNNTVTDNTANSNTNDGILIEDSSNNTLTNNIANSNSDDGISIFNSTYNIVTGNTALNNTGAGTYISYYSRYNTVTGNTFSNNSYGVYFSDADYNTLANNNISLNGGHGIYFWVNFLGPGNNNITNNTISSNGGSGIYLADFLGIGSKNNTITNNTISNSTDYGIYINTGGSGNLIYNNYFNNTNNTYDKDNNDWNTTYQLGTNIISGSYLGGNFYAKPDGTGCSESLWDNTGDRVADTGNCTIPGGSNIDYLPLTYNTDLQISFANPTPSNGSSVRQNKTVNITAIDTIDAIQIMINNSVVKTCNSSPCTFVWQTANGSYTDGSYYINATANDTFANLNSTSTIIIIVDNTGPTVEAGSNETVNTELNSTSSRTTTASASDALSGIGTYIWTASSGNIAFSSNTSLSTTINASAGGTYTITLNVTDTIGNTNSDTFTLIWDIINPTISNLGSNATNNLTKSSVNLNFTVIANDTNIQNVTLNGTLMNLSSGTIYSYVGNASALGCTADGPCNLVAVITDKAGNINTTNYTLTIDDTAPVINTVNLSQSIVQNNTNVTITVNITENAVKYVFADGLNLTFQGGSIWNGTITLFSPSGVVNITVVDNASNVGYGNVSYTVDESGPAFDHTVEYGQHEFNTAFYYDVNATDVSLPLVFAINDTNFTINSTSGVIINATALSKGIYWLTVTVNDSFGNTNSGVFNVTVSDSITPWWVALNTSQFLEYSSAFSYDANASDANGITSLIYSINDTSNFTINSSTGVITNNTGLVSLGIHTLQLNVTDGTNINSTLLTINVSDTISPTWTHVIPGLMQVEWNTSFYYDTNASDGVAALTQDIIFGLNDTSNFTINSTTGVITNATFVDIGNYSLNTTIDDTRGHLSEMLFVISVVDTQNPTWTNATNTSIERLTTLSHTVTAVDNYPTGLTYGLSGSIYFTIDNSGFITNSSAPPVGTYSLSLTATDASGNTNSTNIAIKVNDTITPNINDTAVNLSAAYQTNGAIILSWSNDTQEDVVKYNIYRRENNNFTAPLNTSDKVVSNIFALTLTDTSTSANTTYYYVITAVDAVGNENQSSFTSVVNATTSASCSNDYGSWSSWSSCSSSSQSRTRTRTCYLSVGDTDTETETQSCDSSSSSGSSSWRPPSTPLTLTNVTITIAEMKNGSPSKVEVTLEGLGVYEVEVDVKKKVENVTFTFTKHNSKPSGTDDPEDNQIIFRYLEIKQSKGNSDVNKVKIKFKLEKSWIEDNNLSSSYVRMYRYTTTWEELKTVIKDQDSDHVFFEVETYGFSFFKIAAITSPAPEDEKEVVPEVTPEVVAEPEPEVLSEEPPAEQKKKFNPWFLIVVVLALGGFAALFYFKRKPKKEKPLEEVKKELDKHEKEHTELKETKKETPIKEKLFEIDINVKGLKQYIKDAKKEGYSNSEVKEKLVGAGWPHDMVEKELEGDNKKKEKTKEHKKQHKK